MLAALSRPGNERLFVPRSRWDTALAALSPNDEIDFAPADMAQLVTELDELCLTLEGEDLAHVEAVIALARRCEALPGAWLSFGPR